MEYKELDTILCLNKVTVAYGDNVVLKDINIIEKDIVREGTVTGQIIAVVGRSGCGKSTLFKALTGLKKPKEGGVWIADYNTEGNEEAEAKIVEEGDIGFVNQHYPLFRHKTVDQILLFALRESKLSKDGKDGLIEKKLQQWDLLDQRRQYPNELSGGQRQRVAILEQVLSHNRFFVLDEPTSGLDVPGIENVKEAFSLIRNEDELNTIIFSSHLLEFAVEMADVVYYIGKPTADATHSTIIKKFDLKARGLAWKGSLTEGHIKVVQEIRELMFKDGLV